jgi:hypothetical protein
LGYLLDIGVLGYREENLAQFELSVLCEAVLESNPSLPNIIVDVEGILIESKTVIVGKMVGPLGTVLEVGVGVILALLGYFELEIG